MGIPPTKFDEKVIAGALERDSSETIIFKNPFKEIITVNITIEADSKSKEAFELLMKKPKVQIGALNVLQIPFSFLPHAISEYFAQIIITMNEKITWRYPIKGITESYSNGIDFHLKTKCRVKYEQELKINLPGVGAEITDIFTINIVNQPKELKDVISKWLNITPTKNTLSDPNDNLIFQAKFTPMKPFRSTLDIAVVKASGGRWKFKLILESTEPDVDDTIMIASPINKTSSVSFKLTNPYKQAAEFVAGFSSDSDSEFTIIPKIGFLDAYGKYTLKIKTIIFIFIIGKEHHLLSHLHLLNTVK